MGFPMSRKYMGGPIAKYFRKWILVFSKTLAMPAAPAAPAGKLKRIYIDLTNTQKPKKKSDLKAVLNKKQSEKRSRESKLEREVNESLSLGEKEMIAKG
jgi:hypothetical protein